MKRDVPATPFEVDGPNSTWTSSDSPENPVGQLATMTQAGAQEVATMTTLAKRGHTGRCAWLLSGGSLKSLSIVC
jgi:hypothetical protein